jgi:hypothetical protein
MSSPAPTADTLPTLATVDDIVARLGRNLSQVEAARIDAMLKDGSAIIRRYARKDFIYAEQDKQVIIADVGVIVLTDRPVISVDAVVALSGIPGIPDLPVTWYVFDGIDKITVLHPRQSGIINLPYAWYTSAWYNESFLVTFSHGENVTPPEVLGLLCTAIISELSTPTMSATVQSETIGAYSYSMRRRAVGGGLYATLMDFGMQTILGDYRNSAGTLHLRF